MLYKSSANYLGYIDQQHTTYTMSFLKEDLIRKSAKTTLLIKYIHAGASPGFGRGGGQEFFFSDLEICI